jgi:hypothetical protein
MESTLCIPRMEVTISKNYIHQTLTKLKWGSIIKINEIPLRNDPSQKRVIIKIRWTDDSNRYKERIDKGDSIKLVHSENSPWFWKIVQSKTMPNISV